MTAQDLFGKELEDITLQDLTDFFQAPREESDTIEYKTYENRPGKQNNSFAEKEKVILKVICAFLNSNGGILIWGAPLEQNDEEGNKYYERELRPIEKLIKKDDFIAKISNRLIPTPADVKCHVIPIGDAKCVLTLEVRQSNTRPHQFDNRYYMRVDGATKTAPHHYIEALFKQVQYPDIRGYIVVEDVEYFETKFTRNVSSTLVGQYQILLKVVIANLSGLINEEDLVHKLNSSYGGFLKESTRFEALLISKGEKFPSSNLEKKELLFYGEPISYYTVLKVMNSDFKGNGNLIFSLSFGGKKSPLKVSTYEGNLRRIGGIAEFKMTREEENTLNIDRLTTLHINVDEYIKKLKQG